MFISLHAGREEMFVTQRAREITVALPIHEEDARRFTESGVSVQALEAMRSTGNMVYGQERRGLRVDGFLADLASHGFVLWRVTIDTTGDPLLTMHFSRGGQVPLVPETIVGMIREVAGAYIYHKLEAIACEGGSLFVKFEEALIGSLSNTNQHVRFTPAETIQFFATA